MSRSFLKTLGISLALLYVAITGALFMVQRDFIYFPDVHKPDFRAASLTGAREVELTTFDGLRLLAWYAPPAEGKPLTLYFHGNAGNLQFREGWLNAFVAAGFGVLMPEYRGYGGNPGRPTEAGLFADADAAMSFLKDRGIGPERVVVLGESLGSGVATYLASQQPIAALVLESPFTSATAVAEKQFWFLPVGALLRDKFDSKARIANVRAPVLILAGEQDRIVPAALSRELFDAAREPKQYWSAPKGGHINLLQYGAGKTVIDFLHHHGIGAS